MKRYWDLTEQQRAELTSEDLAAFKRIELMEKGLSSLDSPVLEEVPEVPKANTTFYAIYGKSEYGSDESIGIAFETTEAAAAFVALKPLRVTKEWRTGNVPHTTNGPLLIKPESIFSEQEHAIARVALTQATAAKERNDKARTAHQVAAKEYADATVGLANDWLECQGTKQANQRLIATLAEFKALADGDEATALRFLEKKHSRESIEAAHEWLGLPSPYCHERTAELVDA